MKAFVAFSNVGAVAALLSKAVASADAAKEGHALATARARATIAAGLDPRWASARRGAK